MFRPRGTHLESIRKRVGGAALALTAMLAGALALPAAVPAASADTCNVRDLTKASKCPGLNLRHAYLAGRNLEGEDLSGANLEGANLTRADLLAANLRGADLRHAILDHASLRNAELGGANFDHAELTGTNFLDARASGATFVGARMLRVNFDRANATAVDFSYSHITTSRLIVSGFKSTIFNHAVLNDVDLQSTDFHFAKFIDANLEHNITIGRINQHFGHTNFTDATFKGAKLTGVKFETPTHIRDAIDCNTVLPDGAVDDLNC